MQTPASHCCDCTPTGSRWQMTCSGAPPVHGYLSQGAASDPVTPSTQSAAPPPSWPSNRASACDGSAVCAKQPEHVVDQPGSYATTESYGGVEGSSPTQNVPTSRFWLTPSSSPSLAKVTTWAPIVAHRSVACMSSVDAVPAAGR